jgi:hypothetical protein
MSDSVINPLLDKGYLPHALIRVGIRRQLADRLQSISTTSLEAAYKSKMRYVELLRTRPIAIETTTANEQHYEVGTDVLKGCLGPRMKYSACLYESGKETLGEAEEKMLDLYVERAGLVDGMSILDLGYVSPSNTKSRAPACISANAPTAAAGALRPSTSLPASPRRKSQPSRIQGRRRSILIR